MKCEQCNKRFGDAGNIRNYKFVCPHCNHIQTREDLRSQIEKNLNTFDNGDNGLIDADEFIVRMRLLAQKS